MKSTDKPVHLRLADLRGFNRLARDATVGLTDLVEAMHHTIVRMPKVLGKPPAGRSKGITGLVYRSVRGVARVVGTGVDVLLDVLAPLIAAKSSSQEREAVLAALNGVLGDYLVASGNPLAIAMGFRASGTPLVLDRAALATAFPAPSPRVLVLLHGLCMNDLQWNRQGHDHGAGLARDLGYTPIYLHYNTGLRISTNGREFADLMEALLHQWPYTIERLGLIGHSMGGLVARSAVQYAALAGHAWPKRIDDIVFLGTPHFGAPLERAGARADYLLGISPYTAPFARLGNLRSAGIKDLRQGIIRDDAPQSILKANPHTCDRLPLPEGVRCYAIAASQQQHANSSGTRIRGDGLVPLNSALGRHEDTSLSLAIPETRRWVAYGMGHFDLLSNSKVYERIRNWLAVDPGPSGCDSRPVVRLPKHRL